jgi:hypothetical protein
MRGTQENDCTYSDRFRVEQTLLEISPSTGMRDKVNFRCGCAGSISFFTIEL